MFGKWSPLATKADVDGLRSHLEFLFALSNAQNQQRMKDMDARISKAIEDIAATKSIAQSVEAAFPVLAQQIADLKAQIAAIQARGDVATSADLDALAVAAADLEQTNTALAAAVPAKSADAVADMTGGATGA